MRLRSQPKYQKRHCRLDHPSRSTIHIQETRPCFFGHRQSVQSDRSEMSSRCALQRQCEFSYFVTFELSGMQHKPRSGILLLRVSDEQPVMHLGEANVQD